MVISIFSALYGVLVAAPIAGAIGPSSPAAYAVVSFLYVFVVDLLDSVPLRCKLAQIFVSVASVRVRSSASSSASSSSVVFFFVLVSSVSCRV